MNYLTYAILQYESSNFAESLKKITDSAITELLTEDAVNVNERLIFNILYAYVNMFLIADFICIDSLLKYGIN